MSHEVWEEYYDRLAALIAEHRTTLVFVNTRKMVERLARHLSDRLGEDAVGRPSRQPLQGAPARRRAAPEARRRCRCWSRPRRSSSASTSATSTWSARSDRRTASRRSCSGSAAPATPSTARRRAASFRCRATTWSSAWRCCAPSARGELDRLIAYDAPLDVLAQQIVAETASGEWREDDLFALVRRAWPYRDLPRADFDAVVGDARRAASRRGAAGAAALVHRDEVHGRLLARRARPADGAHLGRRDSRRRRLSRGARSRRPAGRHAERGLRHREQRRRHLPAREQLVARSCRSARGVVRVADAHGAPPTIPFWLGEAPARSAELSAGVSDLRRELASRLGSATASQRRRDRLARSRDRRRRPRRRRAGRRLPGRHRCALLGTLPTQETIVLERFFDESGGMQLVLHAPFGSRVNRAWALALRKRFCRQFNFELQAAATEDGLLLSLGPQHSFPLADVFRYLHPASVRDVLDPGVPRRAGVPDALALERDHLAGGAAGARRPASVPSPLQRMQAEDLLAAAFPDAAACLENIPGDRQIPDHPLVAQTVRDCLEEAMDLPQLTAILERIHGGAIRCVARDTPEPSPLCHEILNARPVRVPRRRAAGGAAGARGAGAAGHRSGARRRPGRARRRRHRARRRGGLAGSARRRRAARCAGDGRLAHRRGSGPRSALGAVARGAGAAAVARRAPRRRATRLRSGSRPSACPRSRLRVPASTLRAAPSSRRPAAPPRRGRATARSSSCCAAAPRCSVRPRPRSFGRPLGLAAGRGRSRAGRARSRGRGAARLVQPGGRPAANGATAGCWRASTGSR